VPCSTAKFKFSNNNLSLLITDKSVTESTAKPTLDFFYAFFIKSAANNAENSAEKNAAK
jgi:hypothetical protein